MARRSKDWNEGLSQDLQNPEFAREYLLAAMEEGIPVQAALGKVIRSYCVCEFSKAVKMASPNILRAINLRLYPTQDTLNRLLKPFGLRITVAPIHQVKKKRSA